MKVNVVSQEQENRLKGKRFKQFGRSTKKEMSKQFGLSKKKKGKTMEKNKGEKSKTRI